MHTAAAAVRRERKCLLFANPRSTVTAIINHFQTRNHVDILFTAAAVARHRGIDTTRVSTITFWRSNRCRMLDVLYVCLDGWRGCRVE